MTGLARRTQGSEVGRDGIAWGDATVIVPVARLARAKTRLREILSPEDRTLLVLSLLEGTVRAAVGANAVTRVLVVSPDPLVLERAAVLGAEPVPQRSRGLNPALREALLRVTAPEHVAAILPADIPMVTAAEIDRVFATFTRQRRSHRAVGLVPDRRGGGTNALLLAPATAIDVHFGARSRSRHHAAARSAGVLYVEIESTIGVDVDVAEDLELMSALSPDWRSRVGANCSGNDSPAGSGPAPVELSPLPSRSAARDDKRRTGLEAATGSVDRVRARAETPEDRKERRAGGAPSLQGGVPSAAR